MRYFEDIEAELGVSGYVTDQGDPGSSVSVDLVTGPISEWGDVTTLLTLPADYEDLNISLLDGQTCSVYGFDAENVVVVLNDDGAQKWCHCIKYANGTDYATGKILMTPPMGMRV